VLDCLQVCLCFDARFHRSFIRGLKYNVRFAIKRTTFVFMHEALDVARGGMAAGLRHELLVPPVNARSVIEGPVEVRSNVSCSPHHVATLYGLKLVQFMCPFHHRVAVLEPFRQRACQLNSRLHADPLLAQRQHRQEPRAS